MPHPRQQFGKTGEGLAARHLRGLGYRILARNYRNALGEIDLIADERGTLVFVEVKARRSARYGSPKHALTLRKRRKISMVALAYLKETGRSGAKARFDVVAVSPAAGGGSRVEVIRNAFELAYP